MYKKLNSRATIFFLFFFFCKLRLRTDQNLFSIFIFCSLPRPVDRAVSCVYERDDKPEHAAIWLDRARVVKRDHVRLVFVCAERRVGDPPVPWRGPCDPMHISSGRDPIELPSDIETHKPRSVRHIGPLFPLLGLDFFFAGVIWGPRDGPRWPEPTKNLLIRPIEKTSTRAHPSDRESFSDSQSSQEFSRSFFIPSH
jgi:hypothetical protein